MTWWEWSIFGGLLGLALLLLVIVLVVVAGHLRPLGRAMRRLRLRGEQAQALQAKVEVTAQRANELQQLLERAAARAEQVKGGRTTGAE